MAGFLFCSRKPGESLELIRRRAEEGLDAYARKGVTLSRCVAHERFVLYLFKKACIDGSNLLELGDGDFVATAGTFFYRGEHGEPALRRLYQEFDPERFDFRLCLGHFALLIHRHGRLFVSNDYNGTYAIYTDEARSILSASFLAASRVSPTRTVSSQELWEYVAEGGMYGNRTMIQEITRLDRRFIHELYPHPRQYRKSIDVESADRCWPLSRQVDVAAESLEQYYSVLSRHFRDDTVTALTGGYDSRLTLAVMRKVGLRPHLYVYGKPTDPDVKVALAIAGGEGLKVEAFDKSTCPLPLPQDYPRAVMDLFHFQDGLGVLGPFEGAGELLTRRSRAQKGRVQINSAVGEIWRNLWMAPDRPLRILSFLKSRYDATDFSVFRGGFDKRRFFGVLADKVRCSLEVDQSRLPRDYYERLYILMRVQHWIGPNNSSSALLSHALMPFTEPTITIPSYTVPMRYKHLGLMETLIMQRFDPRLARYPSIYGYDFTGSFPLKARLLDFVKRNMPICARPFLRRTFQNRKARATVPRTMSPEYLSEVFDWKDLAVSEYVNLDAVRDNWVLRRALNVELVINDKYWQRQAAFG